MLKAFLFDASGHDREVSLDSTTKLALKEDQILWLDAIETDQDQEALLGQLLGLDNDDLQLSSPSPRSLNNHGEYFRFSVAALVLSPERSGNGAPNLRSIPLDLIVGKNWLLTATSEELAFLQEFRERDRGETIIGKLSSGTLAASLLDWHLSAYLAALEAFEGWLDLLDVRILASKTTDRSLLKSVVEGRRFIARIRRNLVPQRGVFYGLARPDFALVADTEATEAFRALERRYDRVVDAVEHSRELVQGSFDLFSTRIAESTNLLIRRLTFVSVALGAMGAVAGIFGMNFTTPYTESGPTGFWIVVGSLIAVGAIGFGVSRARGWI